MAILQFCNLDFSLESKKTVSLQFIHIMSLHLTEKIAYEVFSG